MKKVVEILKIVLLGFAVGAVTVLLFGCPNPPHPPDPPIPPDPTPTVAVYAGVYDLMGATGDVGQYLADCADAGAAGVRLFACYSWQGPQPLSPYKQVGTWVHDNGMTFPLYRLSEWNPDYWNFLAAVLKSCGGEGLKVWIAAEDFCSLKGDSRVKYWNPMYSSEEALSPSTPGGVWGEAMKKYHAALYAKIIETANASGVDYLIEPMNEYDIVDGTPEQDAAWHQWAVDAIVGLGVPKSKIIASSGAAPATIAAQCGMYSPHGVGTPDQIKPIPGVAIGATLFSSDGYWTGTGPADIKGRRGPGVDVAADIGRAIIAAGAVGFEYLPRDAYKANNDRACVDGLDLSTVKAMAWAK